jgi:hypothetical protein
VLTFPTEDVTWAFDIRGKYWAKWGFWEPEKGNYERYLGIYSTYAEKWGKFFVQSRKDSRIYAVSREYYTDSGYPLRMSYISGNIDHGTAARKRSDNIRFHVKSNQNTSATFRVRTRDDGAVTWGPFFDVGLSFAQQNITAVQVDRMGIYRSRQYEIVMSDPVSLAFCDFEESARGLRD